MELNYKQKFFIYIFYKITTSLQYIDIIKKYKPLQSSILNIKNVLIEKACPNEWTCSC